MTTYTNADIRIARAFTDLLRAWLTPEEFETMRQLNSLSSYTGCCASHDYCDANMAMLEAFQEVMLREYRFDDEDHRAMNRAWEAAHDLGLIKETDPQPQYD